MNDAICTYLKGKLQTMSFFQVIAGRTQILQKQVQGASGKMDIKKVPISCDVYGIACKDGQPVELIPNSDYKGLVFFESDDIQKTAINRGMMLANVKMICWLNFKKLFNETCISSEKLNAIKTQIEKNLNTRLTRSEANFTIFKIVVTRQSSNGRAVFQNYSFDETVRQFLIPPYVAFSFDIQVYFIAKTCVTLPTISQETC